MGTLFGTDGIRGEANRYPMTAEMALTLGGVIARRACRERGRRPSGHTVLIGQDTRRSGGMLACALAAGVSKAGVDALMAGVIPTPAVAVLTKQTGALAGIVISASHNPYADNGFKIFDRDGYKISLRQEEGIEEELLRAGDIPPRESEPAEPGAIRALTDAEDRYRGFLRGGLPASFSLQGVRVALDCANGATTTAAPALFSGLGADVTALFIQPDGRNINAACGSQHPEALQRQVRGSGAQIGLAFDGDGDRLVAVDEKGDVLSGDQVLAICARHWLHSGRAGRPLLVSTVMSNLGLRQALAGMGIEHRICGVGDREVMETMRGCGALLGGEDSGHILFLDAHTTGDGLYSALRLLQVMLAEGRPLSELARVMTVFPQVLLNVTVPRKPDLEGLPAVQAAIAAAGRQLGERGRVLVRYSGTQMQCRVMVEGPSPAETKALAQQIASAIGQAICH